MARIVQAQPASPSAAEEDEAALIQAAQQSASRFTPLYRKYALPVYRYFYSRLGSQAEAEDLTSQVFLEALESLPRFRRGSSFPVWLFTIVRRRAIDHYRRKRPVVSIEAAKDPPDPAGGPLSAVIRSEEHRLLAEIIAGLEEEERELLRLRFAAELSFKAIASLLGRSEGALKMKLYRLLARMESRLEAEDDRD